MKKLLITLAVVLPALAIGTILNEKINLATVNQVQGVYIFVESEPVNTYIYLGTVKNTVTFGSGQFDDVKKTLLKKAKKEYPGANGLIIHFVNGGTDYADAIILNKE